MISKEYLAGFIDGEGSIALYKHKDNRVQKGYTLHPKFVIANTNEVIIKAIQKEIGGKIKQMPLHKGCKVVRVIEFQDYKQIKKILESSDLSERIDYYSMRITQYLNEVKLPHLRGEDKLRRVIQRYIPFSTFPESIPKDMKQSFKNSLKFDGGLKLQSVNMSNEDSFFGDLTRRIYSLRNSLVHSTMELSEIKRSVSTSSNDQDKLSIELNLIRLVAKEIMTRSSLRDEL